MADDIGARDAKVIQYLNEAYGKEKELETALEAHIALTTRDSYKKRLKDHLKETKAQAKGLERRIKQLGGKAEAVPAPGPDVVAEAASTAQAAASKMVAAAKGPLHAIRGTSEPEKMLKNAKTEFFNEAEEIANYNAIETLAVAVGDRETAKLARDYRRQEERMAKFLDRTIVAAHQGGRAHGDPGRPAQRRREAPAGLGVQALAVVVLVERSRAGRAARGASARGWAPRRRRASATGGSRQGWARFALDCRRELRRR